jgi:hypothetical protein
METGPRSCPLVSITESNPEVFKRPARSGSSSGVASTASRPTYLSSEKELQGSKVSALDSDITPHDCTDARYTQEYFERFGSRRHFFRPAGRSVRVRVGIGMK